MGFNIVDYKEALTNLDVNEASKWNNADGKDPYAYAGGDDEYDYASGYLCELIIKKDKKAECEKSRDERKTSKRVAKSGETESDKIIAQAILAKQSKPEQAQMSPLAITGIIVGSLLAITVMVVVIKKVKANRG